MNLSSIKSIAETLCLLVVAGSAAFFAWDTHQTQVALRKGITTGYGLNQALDTVNRPCAPGPCGTLANLDKLTVKMSDILVVMQTQVMQTGKLVTAAANNLNVAGDSVKQVAGSLTDTARAATGTLKQTQTDLVTLNESIVDTQPLLDAYTQSGEELNALLRRKAVTNFVDNLGPLSDNFVAITGTGEHMLQTGDAVETKATDSYLHPSKNPWVRDWKATYPWLLIGAQGAVKWSPVVP